MSFFSVSHSLMAFLEVNGITKQFGATLALDAVRLSAEAGEVHAIVGENG